jgi:hypothetical protein
VELIPYQTTENSMTKIMADGLTTKKVSELLPLAKSWLSPPEIAVTGEGFRSEGYDAAERAFVLVHDASARLAALDLTIKASEESPVVNPAIVVKNWGEGGARLKIDGRPVAGGKDLRCGIIRKLEGTDLVIWIRKESVTPVKITLASEGQ